MEQQHTQKATKSPVATQREPQHGSTTTDGQSTTPASLHGINIKTKAQAIAIRSELQASERSQNSKVNWWVKVHRKQRNSWRLGEVLHECWKEDLPCPMHLERDYAPYAVVMHRVEQPDTGPAHTSVDEFRKPAYLATIMAHLMRMSAHKHIKGDEKQKAFLLKDYAQRLFEMKVLEVDLFLACDYFISEDDSEFFPSFAKLKKSLRGK